MNQLSEVMQIEASRDRLVKRVSIAAWGVTLLVVLMFGGIIGVRVARMIELYQLGVADMNSVQASFIPLLGVVGVTSLLLALVSTAAVFMRFRTASLGDIQLRLASLETALAGDETAEDPLI